MRLGLALAMAVALGACASDTAAGDGDYMDDDLPMGMCGATGCDTDGGVPIGFPCGGTNECSGDAVCIAPYENEDVGEFTCSAQCLPLGDESSWCLDASACCDANAICNARGLCLPGEPGADESGTGAATGTSTGTSTGSGTAGDSSTGGATSTGTGTDSGTGTGTGATGG